MKTRAYDATIDLYYEVNEGSYNICLIRDGKVTDDCGNATTEDGALAQLFALRAKRAGSVQQGVKR